MGPIQWGGAHHVIGVLTTYRSGTAHPAPEAGLAAHVAAALLRDPDLADPPGEVAAGRTLNEGYPATPLPRRGASRGAECRIPR